MDHIEKIIQKAMERGEFDNLPGAGNPLDLRENPFVPPDWQMAYRMLASNGFAPDVVEEDKVLRARMAELEKRLESFARRWDGWKRTPWRDAERSSRLAARQAFLQEYEEELRAINSSIHTFNAKAPGAMRRGTLPIAAMLNAAEARLPT